MVDSASGVFELTDPDDPDDVLYPSEASVAGDFMRQLAGQLLAGRYLEDDVVNLIWDHNVAGDIPPIVTRYVQFRRRGVPPGRIRVNGKKLTKYSTAKRDHYIELILGNASENADRIPGALAQAKRDVAAALGMSVAAVQRRWSNIKSEKKLGPGRPRKK